MIIKIEPHSKLTKIYFTGKSKAEIDKYIATEAKMTRTFVLSTSNGQVLDITEVISHFNEWAKSTYGSKLRISSTSANPQVKSRFWICAQLTAEQIKYCHGAAIDKQWEKANKKAAKRTDKTILHHILANRSGGIFHVSSLGGSSLDHGVQILVDGGPEYKDGFYYIEKVSLSSTHKPRAITVPVRMYQ
jgi:hypothetical protein